MSEEIKEYNVILNNEQVKTLMEEMKEKDKKIERLNNIIDGTKKYCFKRMSELNIIQEKDKDKRLKNFCDNKINAFLEVITEIKMLKDSDKE